MAIRKQLHNVLALTAELGHNNVNEDVRHTLVIDRMGLPEHETHRYTIMNILLPVNYIL